MVNIDKNEDGETKEIGGPNSGREIGPHLGSRDLLVRLALELSVREGELFRLFLQGYRISEIAKLVDEDRPVIRNELKNIHIKIRLWLKKQIILAEEERFKVEIFEMRKEFLSVQNWKGQEDDDFEAREKSFIEGLRESGLLVDLPNKGSDDDIRGNFKRIQIKGKTISETIIEERR